MSELSEELRTLSGRFRANPRARAVIEMLERAAEKDRRDGSGPDAPTQLALKQGAEILRDVVYGRRS